MHCGEKLYWNLNQCTPGDKSSRISPIIGLKSLAKQFILEQPTNVKLCNIHPMIWILYQLPSTPMWMQHINIQHENAKEGKRNHNMKTGFKIWSNIYLVKKPKWSQGACLMWFFFFIATFMANVFLIIAHFLFLPLLHLYIFWILSIQRFEIIKICVSFGVWSEDFIKRGGTGG